MVDVKKNEQNFYLFRTCLTGNLDGMLGGTCNLHADDYPILDHFSGQTGTNRYVHGPITQTTGWANNSKAETKNKKVESVSMRH